MPGKIFLPGQTQQISQYLKRKHFTLDPTFRNKHFPNASMIESHRDSNLPFVLYLSSFFCWQNISLPFTTCRLNLTFRVAFQATNDVALHLLLHHSFQEIHGANPSILTCRDQTSIGHDVGTNRLASTKVVRSFLGSHHEIR